MVQDLPENYIFMLLPCYKQECTHPVCCKGRPENEPTWFKDGPPLSLIPLPIPDPEKPYGGKCEKCEECCTGHYLAPQLQYDWIKKNGKMSFVSPPSKVLKTFVKAHETFAENDVKLLAKKCLLSKSDVQMWLQNAYNTKKKKGKYCKYCFCVW
jgi:hypothetical protein